MLGLLLLLAAAQPAPAPALGAPEAVQVQTLGTAPIADNAKMASVDLVLVGEDRLFLRMRDKAGAKAGGVELAPVATLLAALADKRLAPLWPALLAHAGPDPGRHRDRLLARTETGIRLASPQVSTGDAQSERIAEPWVLASLQRLDAMAEAGRFEEGAREMQAAIARAAAGRHNTDPFAEFQLRAALARQYAMHDLPDRALAVLAEGEKNPRSRNDCIVNYWVNRAAILAELGRYAEALALVDATAAKSRKIRGGRIFDDSQLHFGWIRACALNGLGRTAEAVSAYAPLREAGPEMAGTRARALVCMHDDEGLAAELIRQLSGPGLPATAVVALQPGASAAGLFRQAYARAAARADVRAAFDVRARVLPPVFEPALRGWAAP